ncbi:MAG: nitroreductase family protein [Desulfurivibrio sp.]|nr:nitroreductase family protein [Desulfurivibrio sp.]
MSAAGRPSAKNGQPVNWLLIESSAEMRRIIELTVDALRANNVFPGIISAWEEEGVDKVLHGAPHLAIASAAENSMHPEIDCAIALTYLDLAAHSRGLGTCWAGIFMGAVANHPPLLAALALPEGDKIQGALMLGYPKFQYPRIPPRKPLKVTWR